MAEVVCPLCTEVGRSGTLLLRQINANEAVYVCNNSQCPYPVSLSDQIVQNSVPELQPNADQPKENGIILKSKGFLHRAVILFLPCFLLGVAEKEQSEAAVPTPESPTIDDYEVNLLLDPELDALMQEL